MVAVNTDNLGLGSKLGKRYRTNGRSNKFNNDNVNVKRLKLSRSNTSIDKRSPVQEESFALETDNDNKSSEPLLRNECPATICMIDTMGLMRSRKLLRVFLNSGSSKTLVKRSALPKGV